jgi:hypothetical protein
MTNPPNGFVLFGLAYLKSQYTVNIPLQPLSYTGIHRVISATWNRLGAEEKARVEHEAERADELHMAMVGSHSGGLKGKKIQEKYQNWTGSLSEFWIGIWDRARRAGSLLWTVAVGIQWPSRPERDGGMGYFAERRSKFASRSRSWDGNDRVPRPPDIISPGSPNMSEGDTHLVRRYLFDIGRFVDICCRLAASPIELADYDLVAYSCHVSLLLFIVYTCTQTSNPNNESKNLGFVPSASSPRLAKLKHEVFLTRWPEMYHGSTFGLRFNVARIRPLDFRSATEPLYM